MRPALSNPVTRSSFVLTFNGQRDNGYRIKNVSFARGLSLEEAQLTLRRYFLQPANELS